MTTSLLNDAPLFLTTGEVARLLGRHPRTLRNWRDEGKGPVAVRLGYKWAYRRQDIDAYLDSLTAETADQTVHMQAESPAAELARTA
jgi:excisionase family DNA binding protein